MTFKLLKPIFFLALAVQISGAAAELSSRNVVVEQDGIAVMAARSFDSATVTVVGPEGFTQSFKLGAEKKLNLHQLELVQDGQYTFEISYQPASDYDIVVDAVNGREAGAFKATQTGFTESGYFQVFDGAIVINIDAETENYNGH
ncbi:hypothetical protein ORJ04_18170 [Rheinheimera baltica]|uniref:Uncharacterized protein n=1 Tax=Rheinheimera baltica TaxID=67576 RepID=A0ABT9I3B5_9GAMM|nr:hypothetical protein [Rheinheimera baltica]MDP5137882.1 hypothetical protein [Rheinheimera baltica]MDP5149765.1 hypothetical protein [Rheinheimera baltica]